MNKYTQKVYYCGLLKSTTLIVLIFKFNNATLVELLLLLSQLKDNCSRISLKIILLQT